MKIKILLIILAYQIIMLFMEIPFFRVILILYFGYILYQETNKQNKLIIKKINVFII